MKTLITLYLAFTTLTAHAGLPSGNPETAVFVTSCNEIITAVIVMRDGKALFFDRRSGISSDQVKELAERSRTPARVYEVGCFKGEDAVRI